MGKTKTSFEPTFFPGRGPTGKKGSGFRMGQPKVRVKNMKGVLIRLWSYIVQVKFQFLSAAILIAFSTVLQIAAPFFQGIAIDEGIIAGKKEKLIYILILIAVIYILSGIITLFQNFIMIGVSQRVVRNLRNSLFSKLQTLSLSYFDRHPHGELISRVSNDIDLISQTLSTSMTQLISSVLSVTGVAAMMMILNLKLALIALITIPMIIAITKNIARYTRRGYKDQQKYLGSLNGHIEESVSALRTVKLFGTEESNLNAFSRTNIKLRSASNKANIFGGVMGPLMNLIRNLNYVIVAFAGGYLAYKGLLSIGLIAVFLQYTRQFSRPLNQIAQLYNSMQSALAGAERVFAIFDEIPEIKEIDNSEELTQVKGFISFDRVDFSYIEGQKVLIDLSFRAEPGETIAIVGETGAGKTTIVNLLTRFYDIDSGLIQIDNINIQHLKLKNLRENLGFVLQDTFLFSDTVMENIRYGKPEATDREVIQAAEMANAHHFIETLADGYKSILSSEGNNLSEGQKQLLAIARVIISNPSILILDEATSSVDTRTEIHIQDALLKLMKGRTSFVIAHRLSTIRKADKILVLEQGRIVEKGNHRELLERKGSYYKLYSSQFNSSIYRS